MAHLTSGNEGKFKDPRFKIISLSRCQPRWFVEQLKSYSGKTGVGVAKLIFSAVVKEYGFEEPKR
jgi:hypothetical protein